ncbi:MAG: peptidylprolyl isomerase [Spirulinaceae cyanobacterium]
MPPVLKIGQRTIAATDLLPLLQQYDLLPKLVQELIVEEAIAPLECSEAALYTARAAFCQQHHLETPQQLQQWLQQRHLTIDGLNRQLVRSLKLEQFKTQRWGETIATAFQNHKDQLDQVVYSLLRTQDAGIAQELYFRLADGEATFAELARQYSQGPEAKTGGRVGPVPIAHPHAIIGQMLRRSQSGQLWPPTNIENWVVIVRLEQYLPAQLDETTRNQLLEREFQQWLQQQQGEVLQQAGQLVPPVPPGPVVSTESVLESPD